MKLKYAWVALITLTLFGCDDNTGSLGLGMFPEGDQNIKGNIATYDVTTQSELAEKVFAKTSIGYIGKFTDPFFGYYEAGFLAQLHCIENMKFPPVWDGKARTGEHMVDGKIYATELVLGYTSYFGDSLNACRMSIYQLGVDKDGNTDPALQILNKNQEDIYFTNIEPRNYYNPAALIGRKAYSAVDLSFSDSIRNSDKYFPTVRVSLPKTIGEKIYDAYKATEGKGLTNDEFQKLFRGVYAKSDYGDGTVLYIDQIEMNVVYEMYAHDTRAGAGDTILWSYQKKMGVVGAKDSIVYGLRTFAATKEIIQANRFSSDTELIQKRQKEKSWTYLKTPAGIYTQATLPLNEIESKLSKDTINAVKLTFTNYNQENDNNKYKFTIGAPRYVLLVREKDKEKFFEQNKIADNVTSYLAQHNEYGANQYTFNNLTRLVSTCLAEKEAAVKELKSHSITVETDNGPKTVNTIEEWIVATKWEKVAIIPVLVSYDSSSQTNPNVISVQNDLKPGYVKLKGGADGLTPGNTENKLKLEVIYTSFGK